jgi:serine/threonine-protein phosphatase 5
MDLMDKVAKNSFSKPTFFKDLLRAAIEEFTKEPIVNYINFDKGRITIVGDIHGSLSSLLKILESNGEPSEENLYLFNGDYADRGNYGLECYKIVLFLKTTYPKYVFMNRGNHESLMYSENYGFLNEIGEKYKASREVEVDIENIEKEVNSKEEQEKNIGEKLAELFKQMPLIHIINKVIFVVHGGLPVKYKENIKKYEKLKKKYDYDDEDIQTGLLFNDPTENEYFLVANNNKNLKELTVKDRKIYKNKSRGGGYYFTEFATQKFLSKNKNLKLIIRSHESVPTGFFQIQDNRVITIFSASCYCNEQYTASFLTLPVDVIENLKTEENVPDFREYSTKIKFDDCKALNEYNKYSDQ